MGAVLLAVSLGELGEKEVPNFFRLLPSLAVEAFEDGRAQAVDLLDVALARCGSLFVQGLHLTLELLHLGLDEEIREFLVSDLE